MSLLWFPVTDRTVGDLSNGIGINRIIWFNIPNGILESFKVYVLNCFSGLQETRASKSLVNRSIYVPSGSVKGLTNNLPGMS